MTTHICPRCKQIHHGKSQTCNYCLVVAMSTPVQSQSERDWEDHVEDYRHQDDWLDDGRCSEH